MKNSGNITIVLDVDGVVGNLADVFFKAVRELKERNSWDDVDLNQLKTENIRNWDWDGISLYNESNKDERLSEVWKHINLNNLWDEEKPFPGAIEVITEWHRMDIPVRYITKRTNEQQIQDWLSSQKLVLSEDDINITDKPADKADVLRKLASKGKCTLFFDDDRRNIDAALEAKIGHNVICYYVILPWAWEHGVSPDTKENMVNGAYTAFPNWDKSFRSIPSRVEEVLSGKVGIE